MERQNAREDQSSMFRLPRSCFNLVESLVEETTWFDRQMDVCRVAISVALARGMQASKDSDETLETKFSISGLDPDGSLRELVLALAPECGKGPYDYAQRLANRGIRLLHNELVERGRPLPEVLGLHADQEAETSDAD